VFAHSMGVSDMLFGFLLPALIGNIVGGFLLVALLNHGQVAAAHKAVREAERRRKKQRASHSASRGA
jgi:formate/nitrite transporter FocA (FNT family)